MKKSYEEFILEAIELELGANWEQSTVVEGY